MKGQLSMFDLTISEDTDSATSSPASVDGRSHSDSQATGTTPGSGQEAAPVSHSQQQGKAQHTTTNGIYGLRCSASSESAALQQSLASRLQARLGSLGSTTYALHLESAGYSATAANLPACSVGAPHIRQRLWWVADANTDSDRLEAHADQDVIRGQDSTDQGDGRLGEMGASGQWATARPRGARPMAVDNGVPSDMGRLRAYGNAIVPQVASEFIGAYKDVMRCKALHSE